MSLVFETTIGCIPIKISGIALLEMSKIIEVIHAESCGKKRKLDTVKYNRKKFTTHLRNGQLHQYAERLLEYRHSFGEFPELSKCRVDTDEWNMCTWVAAVRDWYKSGEMNVELIDKFDAYLDWNWSARKKQKREFDPNIFLHDDSPERMLNIE